ncbi:MAG TPA: C39 family peptidase [Burkholderiales bacterium]|nr:C39 family peptidase [Burkholderiales bacterium]
MVFAALATLLLSGFASATGVVRFLGESGDYSLRIATLKELRDLRAFRTTIRQQHDFSCGSAAVATLLTYHYGRAVTEAEVFRVMYEQGDKDKIQRYGFSLLDMKRYLAAAGFQADGFEVTLDKLREARLPAIALVRENGYNHFVVIKGVRDDKVLVGDPSSGGRIIAREDFERVWNERILFVIRNHTETAHFDVPEQWQVRLAAPLHAESMNRSGLADPTLMMRGINDF